VGVGTAGEETGVDEDRCSGVGDFDRRAVRDLFEETEKGDLVIWTFKSKLWFQSQSLRHPGCSKTCMELTF
jgi:hypothetical protein